MIRKLLSVLCALCLMTGIGGLACADSIQGQAMPDFTVELTDGAAVTLSDLLSAKEVVVLNIFATWCDPCREEFPEMEAVYRQYKDKMEIIAVSEDPGDDLETLRRYKEELGLSFLMGQAGADITGNIEIPGFPTTLIIDRNGQVAHFEPGSFVSGKAFEQLVTALMGDVYPGKQLWRYTILIEDQKMELVPNVNVQCCTDTMCQLLNTGDDGFVFVVAEEPVEYHFKLLSVPDGYTMSEDNEVVTNQSGRYLLKAYKQN